MEIKIKMNTQSGQVYINNKCLHQDAKGYYTIKTIKFAGKNIRHREDITDPAIIQQLNNFCNS